MSLVGLRAALILRLLSLVHQIRAAVRLLVLNRHRKVATVNTGFLATREIESAAKTEREDSVSLNNSIACRAADLACDYETGFRIKRKTVDPQSGEASRLAQYDCTWKLYHHRHVSRAHSGKFGRLADSDMNDCPRRCARRPVWGQHDTSAGNPYGNPTKIHRLISCQRKRGDYNRFGGTSRGLRPGPGWRADHEWQDECKGRAKTLPA